MWNYLCVVERKRNHHSSTYIWRVDALDKVVACLDKWSLLPFWILIICFLIFSIIPSSCLEHTQTIKSKSIQMRNRVPLQRCVFSHISMQSWIFLTEWMLTKSKIVHEMDQILTDFDDFCTVEKLWISASQRHQNLIHLMYCYWLLRHSWFISKLPFWIMPRIGAIAFAAGLRLRRRDLPLQQLGSRRFMFSIYRRKNCSVDKWWIFSVRDS